MEGMERVQNCVHLQCSCHMCFRLYEHTTAHFWNQIIASYQTGYAISFEHDAAFRRTVFSDRQIRECDNLSTALLVTNTHFWNQLTISCGTAYAMSLTHEMILKQTVLS